jgi:hypothetical protein
MGFSEVGAMEVPSAVSLVLRMGSGTGNHFAVLSDVNRKALLAQPPNFAADGFLEPVGDSLHAVVKELGLSVHESVAPARYDIYLILTPGVPRHQSSGRQ